MMSTDAPPTTEEIRRTRRKALQMNNYTKKEGK